MPKACSNVVENLLIEAVILPGCSARVFIIRSATVGLCRINSAAATIKERLLLMSCRILASWRFNSPSCSIVKVTGSLGRPISKLVLNRALKASLEARTGPQLGEWGTGMDLLD